MITIYRTAERPGLDLFWLDTIKRPVDLSGSWTFTVSVEQDLVETALSGVTVTGNADPTTDTGSAADVPSLSLVFAAGALDDVAVGPALLRVDATSAGRNRRLKVPVRIED